MKSCDLLSWNVRQWVDVASAFASCGHAAALIFAALGPLADI